MAAGTPKPQTTLMNAIRFYGSLPYGIASPNAEQLGKSRTKRPRTEALDVALSFRSVEKMHPIGAGLFFSPRFDPCGSGCQ